MQKQRPYLTTVVFVAVVAAALAFAGTRSLALTVAVLLGLIGFHELGHFWVAKACGVGSSEFSIGFGPLLFGTRPQPGRTRFVLRAIPLGGYVRIKGMAESGAEIKDDNVPGKSYAEVSAPRQIAIAAAGPVANLLIAVVVMVSVFGLVGVPSPTTAVDPAPDGPAAAAGMVSGDRIVAVGGTPVVEWEQVGKALGAAPAGDVEVVVDRAGEELTFVVSPAEVDGARRMGVVSVSETRRLSPVEAVTAGVEVTGEVVVASAQAFARIPAMVAGIPSQVAGSAENPNERFVSPIGMAGLASQSLDRDGVAGVLVLVALVSVFLALFNLLPIPPLDGGHIVIAAYEAVASKVARRPVAVNRVVVSRIAMGFAAVLVFIGVSSLLLDVLRPVALP